MFVDVLNEKWKTDDRMTQYWSLIIFVCSIYILASVFIWPSRYATLVHVYIRNFLILMPICVIVMLVIGGACLDKNNPLSAAVKLFKNNFINLMMIILFMILFFTAFTTYKFAIPDHSPFYFDWYLVEFERFVFGDDPWRLTRSVVSGKTAEILSFNYSFVWVVLWLGMFVFIGIWSDKKFGARYLLAHALTIMICGTILATIFSSVGPILHDRIYDPDRFEDLAAVMNGFDGATKEWLVSSYLLAAHQSGQPQFGSGISAMPSVHVAVAALNACFFASLNRWLGVAGWIYVGIILFTSVYTGWHYLSDGVVSIVVVGLVWRATGKLFETGKEKLQPIGA